MKSERKQLEMFREIIVDNFAGGGGASTGIAMAIGRNVDIAINHDQDAIAMHQRNHPGTEHYCESVWDIDPRKATGGRPVALCWLSPDCKHFSKAKGGKPVEKHIRGLAWVAIRWAATVRPRVIMLENVEEFQTWGPLLQNNMPDPKQKGRTFRAFVNAFRRLGYEVDFREIVACDYGAPTKRKRFFLIARRDGQPIEWPEPTHGDPKSDAVRSGKLKPWRTAAEIINWSLPCRSIFERKRPLAENTMRRIARGLFKFVIDNPDPFVIKVNHKGERFRGQEIDEPFQTVTAKNGWGVVTPIISRQFGKSVGSKVDDPLATITAGGGGKSQLVSAFITKFRTGATGSEMTEPLHTITSGAGSKRPAGAAHAMGMVAATMIKHFGGNYNGPGNSLNDPLSTVTATDHNAIVAANLVKYHGAKSETDTRGQMPDEPLRTVDTSNRYGLVTSHLMKMKGTNCGQEVTEPVQTITAGGLHFGEVRAFLLKYYGTATGQKINEPIHTITAKDRLGLVTIHGEDYRIIDIGMRMLTPRELFDAQGFPKDYVIDVDAEGKKISQSAQVARCGNAVPPQFAEALVRANLLELCEQGSKEAAANA